MAYAQILGLYFPHVLFACICEIYRRLQRVTNKQATTFWLLRGLRKPITSHSPQLLNENSNIVIILAIFQ